MRAMLRRLAPIAVAATAAGALAGCGSNAPPAATTVTVTSSHTPTVTRSPSRSTTSSASHSTATAIAPVTASKHLTAFRGTCESLLPAPAVSDALGAALPAGVEAFVVGQPDRTISRIAYLNCRYGVTGKGAAAVPKIEIGISLYTTAAKAAERVTATSADYTTHGAESNDVDVSGLRGVLLTGGVGTGYDVPLLVVATDQRTVAVGVAASVASGGDVARVSSVLATFALQRTAS